MMHVRYRKGHASNADCSLGIYFNQIRVIWIPRVQFERVTMSKMTVWRIIVRQI